MLAAALLLAGCASPGPRLSELESLPAGASPVELAGVPFHPQEALQCGPAALATVLGAAGRSGDPAALAPEIFTPGLGGSLQPEILGALRRRDLLPYVLPPELDALAAELVAGRPVLVLQNLGLESLPAWHYAVVVGADPARERLILRSGTERRQEMSTRRFLRTWNRAERWAVVALEPGRLPARPDRERYLAAASGLESAGRHAAAEKAWQAALEAWPDEPVALFGLGNARYGSGNLEGARRAWRAYLAQRPDDPAGLNNLAMVTGELGCAGVGLELADRARIAAGPGHPLAPAIQGTLEELRELAARRGASDCR